MEVTEPNFTATKVCRGWQPVVEISATGWVNSPDIGQKGTTEAPAKATISAGPLNIIVSQAPTGGNFVIGGSTTLIPAQTITIDDTPVVLQTTAGEPELIVGTTTIPLQPNGAIPEITGAPAHHLPPVFTIGTQILTANVQTQYVIANQTLSPGGPALTISGTILSLEPCARALIINGTTLRLGHSRTAVVARNTTSVLQPVTTVVTLTRSLGASGVDSGVAGATSESGLAYDLRFASGWSGGGLLLLAWWGLGFLAVQL